MTSKGPKLTYSFHYYSGSIHSRSFSSFHFLIILTSISFKLCSSTPDATSNIPSNIPSPAIPLSSKASNKYDQNSKQTETCYCQLSEQILHDTNCLCKPNQLIEFNNNRL